MMFVHFYVCGVCVSRHVMECIWYIIGHQLSVMPTSFPKHLDSSPILVSTLGVC